MAKMYTSSPCWSGSTNKPCLLAWPVANGLPIRQRTPPTSILTSWCRRHRSLKSVAPCTAVEKDTATSSSTQPDLILEAADMPRKIHVFGLSHTSFTPAIAEYILKTKPLAVIVETAMTPEHGARPGNTISCKDRVIEGPAAFFMRMFCQVASELGEQAEQHGGDVTATPLWEQISAGPYRAEQLVYIAALAGNVPVVFGDRPKDITYRRLYTIPSCAQLDEGFAVQASINYHEMLGLPRPVAPIDNATMVERIAMQEREAVMCSVAFETAQGMLPSLINKESNQEVQQQQQQQQPSNDVIMVVGAAHLPGIEQLWSGRRWAELLGCSHTLDSQLLTAPPLSTVGEKEVGLKRGLLHALLRMSATREVLVDVEQTLGPIPPQQQQAFDAVSEVYGSTRTILACLDKQLLDKVCQGLRTSDGQQLDMWQELQPVRAIRPAHGGPGYSEEMVMYLRSLNFDLD